MFLEKTIENWLTNVNELGYQMPYAQLLLTKGHKVHHISRHNSFEQGKDIITTNEKGELCAYQLKGGNITRSVWGKIKQEVEELLEIPVKHPSVQTGKKHKSFLVTNGVLEDTVRILIQDLNASKWKDNPLQVVVLGELISEFNDISGQFLPDNPVDYKGFLDLFFSDGESLIDMKGYTTFITGLLRLEDASLSKEERKRSIASAILYTSYIIGNFKAKNNYVSVFQTLSALCSCILLVVEKYNLKEKYWKDSFGLILDEIKETGYLLEKEVCEEEGLKKLVTTIWDGELGPYRRHIALETLFAHKLSQLLDGNAEWDSVDLFALMSKNSKLFILWGEGAIYSLILIFWYSMLKSKKDAPYKQIADYFFAMMITELIKNNGRKSEEGLLSPYYSIQDSINKTFGFLEEPIDETFTNRSFLLKSLIALAVRYNFRKTLELLWREITYISQEKFIPDELWQNFLWRSPKGKMVSELPKHTQSWKELVDDVNYIDEKLIPEMLKKYTSFAPLFLLVFPHRVNDNVIKFLDTNLNGKVL